MKKLLYSSNWMIPTRFLEDTVYESFFKKNSFLAVRMWKQIVENPKENFI